MSDIRTLLAKRADELRLRNVKPLEQWCELHSLTIGSLKYLSYEALILAEGKEMPAAKRPAFARKRAAKACYPNAWHLVMKYSDLTYCEGYAMTHLGIPVPHAWAIGPNGLVIDETWARPEGCAYMGIAFPEDYVVKVHERTERHGLIVNDWRDEYRLLRDGAQF